MPLYLMWLLGLAYRWELVDATGARVVLRCNAKAEGLETVRQLVAVGYTVIKGVRY